MICMKSLVYHSCESRKISSTFYYLCIIFLCWEFQNEKVLFLIFFLRLIYYYTISPSPFLFPNTFIYHNLLFFKVIVSIFINCYCMHTYTDTHIYIYNNYRSTTYSICDVTYMCFFLNWPFGIEKGFFYDIFMLILEEEKFILFKIYFKECVMQSSWVLFNQ